MKLSYASVRSKYQRNKDLDTPMLYTAIGYPEHANSIYWENTCAIRLSLALIKAGIPLPAGHMAVKAGPNKGMRIEQNVARLAGYLSKKGVLGEPEKYKSATQLRSKLGQRRGIVAFFSLLGGTDRQNHIDLVAPGDSGYHECASACYWGASNAWFWPLR